MLEAVRVSRKVTITFIESEREVLGPTGGRQTGALTDSHCVLWVRIDSVKKGSSSTLVLQGKTTHLVGWVFPRIHSFTTLLPP